MQTKTATQLREAVRATQQRLHRDAAAHLFTHATNELPADPHGNVTAETVGGMLGITMDSHRRTERMIALSKASDIWQRFVFNTLVTKIAGQYLRKGLQAYVEGHLQSSSRSTWTTTCRIADTYSKKFTNLLC